MFNTAHSALSTLVATAAVVLTTFTGTAEAAQYSPWTDCAYGHTYSTIKSVPCRLSMGAPGTLSVHWADGVSDTFTYINDGLVRDTTGGYWTVSKEPSQGVEFLHFVSLKNGTNFAVREF